MSRPSPLYSKTLLFHLWEEFQIRYRFKYVLPKKTEMVLDGIRLDLTPLSLKVRNRLLLGLYEAQEKQMVQEFLAPDDAVIEIGGAIGFIGLLCQKKLGIEHYYSFEANPRTVEILKRNYALNDLTPAVWNLALAPQDGSVELDVGSDFWEHSIVPARREGHEPEIVKVPGACLATLMKAPGRPVNVLIIDVEGAEQYIDAADIPSAVNKIIIELHPEALGAEKMYDFIAGIIRRGFYVAREENGTFVFLQRKAAAVRFNAPGVDGRQHSAVVRAEPS
jgi:FkbM family methyltransferase